MILYIIYIYIRISFITGGETKTKTEKDGQGLCLRPPKSARVGPRAGHWQLTVPIYHEIYIYMLKKTFKQLIMIYKCYIMIYLFQDVFLFYYFLFS